MKKVLIAAVALLAGASLSLAGMGIEWGPGGGWMSAYGGTSEGPGVLEANNVIWQLIYAGADNTANEPDVTKANYLGGDDELIVDRKIDAGGGEAADGTSWDTWLMQQSGDLLYQDLSWSKEGSVYQRIWQGTPTAADGGYYFDTDLLTIDTTYAGEGAAPQALDYDPEGAGVVVNKVAEGSGQVPEPATMSLLGLGALAMVLRRKLSK